MRQLNGHYTQLVNRTYGLSGHLFQGRYKAILVQKEACLLELTRYVVLNPVRAGMVDLPEQWPWSSYPVTINAAPCPDWLDCDWILGQFGRQRKLAIRDYQRFVLEGAGVVSPLAQTRHQLLLGDDSFVAQYQQETRSGNLREVSRAHKR